MKILNIPEMTWQAGRVIPRRCKKCARGNVHISTYPREFGEGRWTDWTWPMKKYTGEGVICFREYMLRSGFTSSNPRSEGATRYDCCRGYKQHSVVFYTKRLESLSVVPTELCTGYNNVGEFSDYFQGTKGEYSVFLHTLCFDEHVSWLCHGCLADVIKEHPQAVKQGSLTMCPWPNNEVDVGITTGFKEWTVDYPFFNHAPKGGFYASQRGRFCTITGPATIKSTDHDDLELTSGLWIGYHPWPAKDRD